MASDKENKPKDSELIIVGDRIYHLGLRPDQLARNIITVGDPARADRVAAHFDSIDHNVNNREYLTRTGTYRGMPVSVVSTGIGTDNTEIALVEAFGLNEFDLMTRTRKQDAPPLTIVRIGTSGGIQKENDVGTLAISTYAIGLDNTGLFYEHKAPDKTSLRIEEEVYKLITDATPDGRRFKGRIHPYVSKASPDIVDALKHKAKDGYVAGITASASGFFAPQGREIPGLDITVPRLQEHLATLDVDGNRIVNFEMESSLLFHLGAKMGYRCATICPIIANRPAGTFLADYHFAVEHAIQTGLDALLELYQKEQEGQDAAASSRLETAS